MRMFAQDRALYRKLRGDGTDDPEARRRLEIVEGVDRMRERFTAAQAVGAFGVSRTTYHEWSRRLGEGADRAAARGALAGPRLERGDGWAHPAMGGGEGAGAAVLVLRGARRRKAAARLHRRACAPVEAARQARRRAVRPHDAAHRRQDVQGVPGGVPADAAAALQGGLGRHGARRQDVPARSRGVARHPRRAGDGGSEFMAEFEAECTAHVECWSQHRGELTCAAMNEALRSYLDYYKRPTAAPLPRHENPRRVR